MDERIPRSENDVPIADSARADSDVNEQKELDNEAKLRKLRDRDVGQRFWLRYAALGISAIMLVFLALFLCKAFLMVHNPELAMTDPEFKMALIISPIVSMTSITLAFITGAFRKTTVNPA